MAIFQRGYKEIRERVQKSAKFTRSCFNCDSFYKAVGDDDEVCQNPNVSKYDLVTTENNIYCSYWKPCAVDSDKNLFKGTGRNREI